MGATAQEEKAITLTAATPDGLFGRLTVYGSRVKALMAEATGLLGQALNGKITSAEQGSKVGELVTATGEMIRKIEEDVDGALAPFKAVVKSVTAMAKPSLDDLKRINGAMKSAVAMKVSEDRRKAKAAAAEANAKALKNYNQRAERAEAKGQEAPPPPDLQKAEVNTNVGGATVRFLLSLEVEDWTKIPAKFLLSVNEPTKQKDGTMAKPVYTLTAAARVPLAELDAPGVLREHKAGRPVPGIRVFDRPSVAG